MLKRHSFEPPTPNVYTDRDLKAALPESRKFKPHTSVNTNLAALKMRDFNQPLAPEEIEKWGGTLRAAAPESEFAVAAAPPSAGASRLIGAWPYTVGGVAALALAAAGFWMFKRRKAADT
jgi:hypothetical protein